MELHRRNRRPPAAPVNVLLSFYTLLAQAAAGAVQSAGLDPYAGFLHEVAYNRPALALDLMEEFRPVVDGVVLWACRSGRVTPADFPRSARTPGCWGRGRRRFIQAYEERMEGRFTHPIRGEKLAMRLCLLEQARQVAARVKNGLAGYQGMGFR
jgi:CRISPR-associated protein Cas1